jgi:hypothetical protein
MLASGAGGVSLGTFAVPAAAKSEPLTPGASWPEEIAGGAEVATTGCESLERVVVAGLSGSAGAGCAFGVTAAGLAGADASATNKGVPPLAGPAAGLTASANGGAAAGFTD